SVRPARVRAQHAVGQRSADGSLEQHDAPPDRRHGATAPTPRDRPVARLRGVVGSHAGPRLCRAPFGAGYGGSLSLGHDDAAHRMTFARLCAHYFTHAAWLDPNELLSNANRLAGIPSVLVHGRFDLGGPPDVPWLLAQAWPRSELHLVRTGHVGGNEMLEPLM